MINIFRLVILGGLLLTTAFSGYSVQHNKRVHITGLYSNLTYVNEPGDFVGIEVFLVKGQDDFFALIQQAEGVFDVAGVFAGMFVLAAFVIVIDMLVTIVERRLLVWRPIAEMRA